MRVAAIIPSYNVAAYLPQAIESVRAQTRAVDEIIVVDDGSSDGSVEVARRLGATCIRTPVNGGPGAARNLGLRATDADVVAFLDADDFWEPGHLAATTALLERHPRAALAFGGVRKFNDEHPDDKRCAPHPPHGADAPLDEPADVFFTLVRENIVTQSAAVARRAALLEAGGYDEGMRHSEDYDLWMRLAMRAPFVAAPGVSTNYRLHDSQASLSTELMVRGWWRARANIRRVAAESGWPQDARARLDDALRQAWESDLRWAWRMCDRRVVEVVLAQRAAVPGADAIAARWSKRLRRFWSFWVPAIALWDLLPQGTKNVLKTPVRTLRGGVVA